MAFEFVAKNGIISKGNVQVTGSVIANSFTGSLLGTASYSITSSFLSGNATGSFFGTSSWASAAVTSSFLNGNATGSFFGTSSWSNNSINAVTSSFLNGNATGSFFGTSSNAVSSSYALTASFALSSPAGASGTTLITASTYQITSSWAINSLTCSTAQNSLTADFALLAGTSISASYANNVPTKSLFSRGIVFYDAGGIAGLQAADQSVIIWRAPFSCTATTFNLYRVTGSDGFANARRNGTGTLLTSSLTSSVSESWVQCTTFQTSSFSEGDKLEIMLISSSGFPTQIAVQIDFTRP